MDLVCSPYTTASILTNKCTLGVRPESYLDAIGQRESAWSTTFGRPRHRQYFFSFSEEPIPPEDHISLLSQYRQVAPYLFPKEDDLATPALRHPDLHQGNIFICPESKQITGIIDWQGACILPFYMQVGFPALCRHETGQPQTLEKPKLNADFDNMSLEEQERATSKLRQEKANLYYTAATCLKNKRHMRALKLPHLEMRKYLVAQAGLPWNGDLVNLRAALAGVQSKWKEFNQDSSCPITFTDEEIKAAMEESKDWNEASEILATARADMDIDEEGGTSIENYNYACARNLEWRMQMLNQATAEEKHQMWRIWPFKDNDDQSCPPSEALGN